MVQPLACLSAKITPDKCDFSFNLQAIYSTGVIYVALQYWIMLLPLIQMNPSLFGFFLGGGLWWIEKLFTRVEVPHIFWQFCVKSSEFFHHHTKVTGHFAPKPWLQDLLGDMKWILPIFPTIFNKLSCGKNDWGHQTYAYIASFKESNLKL